jgi:hypothetical protein
MLALQGHIKLGASERSYGGGLNFNLSNNGTNLLGVNYTHIDGRLGIADDKRIAVSWTYGFGTGPSSKVDASENTDNVVTINAAAADVAKASLASQLLGDVMKRPAFLPERATARARAQEASALCSADGIVVTGFTDAPNTFAVTAAVPQVDDYVVAFLTGSNLPLSITINSVPLTNSGEIGGKFYYTSSPIPTGAFSQGSNYTLKIEGDVNCEEQLTAQLEL